LRSATPSFTPDQTFALDVDTALTEPAEYFEVRLRVRSPRGTLLYQKTEVRHNVEAGRTTVSFGRDLASLGVSPGRHPVEVRVLATGADPTEAAGRLLVVPDDAPPLPVAIVVRLGCSPAIDPAGRFTRDPATDTRLRDDLRDVSRIAIDGSATRFALAVPPILLEELLGAASGYDTLGPTGAIRTEADSEVSRSYASALGMLRSAVATAGLELLDVGYAAPDLAGLESIGALGDLEAHWRKADDVRAALFGVSDSSDSRGAVVALGTPITSSVLRELERRGDVVVTEPAFLSTPGGSAPSAYTLAGSSVRAVVIDAEASALLGTNDLEFYDVMYRRAFAESAEAAVLLVDVGQGRPHTPETLDALLTRIDGADWLTVTDLSSLAASAAASAAPASQSETLDAPDGYWEEIAAAREAAGAFVAAVGPEDPDGAALSDAVLVAESSCWAGADGSWRLAEEGRAFATSVTGFVEKAFGAVTIDVKDVTLSNRSGEIPLTVVNGSGKALRVTLRAVAGDITVTAPARVIELAPAENFLTIPVDLGNAVSDDLAISIESGGVDIASASISVRGSYLDRFAVVGMVVAVLVGLLAYIRRRTGRAIAHNGVDGPADPLDG
jgi:hypothetical protein